MTNENIEVKGDIVLGFNSVEYSSITREATKFLKAVQAFTDELKDRTGLLMSESLLSVLINNSSMQPFEEAITKAVKAQLSAAKVTIPSIIDSSIKGEIEAFYEIYNKYKNAGPWNYNHEYDQELTINDNIIAVGEDFESDLRDRLTDKVATKEGVQLYEMVSDAVNILNATTKLIHPTILNMGFVIAEMIYFDRNSGTYKISEKVSFDYVTKEYKSPR